MSTRSRPLPVPSLGAVRTQGTRIFAAGGDPLFGRRTPPTNWFADPFTGPTGQLRVWRRDLLDRLQTPLTRRPE
jgi:hypothetical protein